MTTPTAVTQRERELGAIIVAHGGTLEHFAGDGMMVFLNDPQAVADHTLVGVRMAVGARRQDVLLQVLDDGRIGLDLPIALEAPRVRTDPAFGRYRKALLAALGVDAH